jgi:hypothetical protein
MWETLLLSLLPQVLPVLAKYPIVQSSIQDVVGSFAKTTAAPPASVPTTAHPAAAPSTFVRNGQHLINQYLKPVPLLKEDGWLGPKTEKVIRDALAPYGIVL